VAGCHLSAIGQRVGGLAHLGQKVGLCQLAAVAGFALPSDSDAIALEVAFTIAQTAHNDLDDVTHASTATAFARPRSMTWRAKSACRDPSVRWQPKCAGAHRRRP
jgi:hypothetical protein